MQFFSRSAVPVPDYFRTEQAQYWRKRLLEYFSSDDDRRAQAFLEPSSGPLRDNSIQDGLSRLFNGKCAFCERITELIVYRFRPDAEAMPAGRTKFPHLYYAWLAEAWENLLPVCPDCVPDRPNFFPVQGGRAKLPTFEEISRYVEEGSGNWRSYPPKESYQLLDPCHDIHFSSNLGVLHAGELVGLTVKGRNTIDHFKLNRDDLIETRAKHFEHLLETVLDTFAYEEGRADFDFARMPFGGSCYLLLRQLGLALGANSTQVSRAQIARYFHLFADEPARQRRVQPALQRIENRLKRRRKGAISVAGPRAGFARLKSISISNFKALENVSVDLPETMTSSGDRTKGPAPALLIIGENAAGKSTMLEAVALALSDNDAIEKLHLSPRAFMLDPELMGADDTKKRPAAVKLEFHGEVRCGLNVSSADFDHRWTQRGHAPPVFAYGAFRHFQSAPTRFTLHKHVRSLFQSDYVLSNPEKWLLTLSEPRFEMVVRSLRSIFAIGEDFEVITRDKQRGRCHIRQRIIRPDGAVSETLLPLSVVSSGFRTILAMTCDLMQGLMDSRVYADFETLRTASAVVLIDEIEAHLHPRWKMQIMRGLREALPNVTFIATTHDPLCIRGMNDGEVIVMRRTATDDPEHSDLPVLVHLDDELPPVSQLTVEQLLTSDIFQLYSTDSIEVERELANVADLLAREAAGDAEFSENEQAALAKFTKDVDEALPVGSGEVQRIAQVALADHLQKRRGLGGAQLKQLNEQTKSAIIAALSRL